MQVSVGCSSSHPLNEATFSVLNDRPISVESLALAGEKKHTTKDIGFPGSVVYLQARRGCTDTISQLISGAASMSTSFRVSNKSFRL